MNTIKNAKNNTYIQQEIWIRKLYKDRLKKA